MVTSSGLVANDFKLYPPLARTVATANLDLFREMPITFLALLLKELIAWDWKFPAERDELSRQLTYLRSLSSEQRQSAFTPFFKLALSPELEAIDWVNAPAQFAEQLSSHLWATHQINQFRATAVDFFDTVSRAIPEPAPVTPRLGIAIIGKGVEHNSYPLFRKLRPHGTYFSQVRPSGALPSLLHSVETRATAHPAPFAHWYIDGGVSESVSGADVTCVSYSALKAVRSNLQERMRSMYESGTGSEAIRSALARMRPGELGMKSDADPVLSRFEVGILTEGSGTQIFSTTFVQWTSREALRRARPLTMLARFAPRQRGGDMAELLSEGKRTPPLDPQGSLIDADMGAYYNWINQQRLTGADHSSFLAWFEAGQELVAIGPSFPRGSTQTLPVEISEILARATKAL